MRQSHTRCLAADTVMAALLQGTHGLRLPVISLRCEGLTTFAERLMPPAVVCALFRH